MILLLVFQRFEMSDDESETWLAFSEISLNAKLRDAMALFARRSPTQGPGSKEEPAALTWEGAGKAAGLTSEGGTTDGEKLVKRA
jgi:hypothetical protein